jgi:Uma2 family endonuclease
MATMTDPDALIRRWTEIIADPVLRDLPYKIELNAWGKIEMSPLRNAHGRAQARIGVELQRLLPEGTGFIAPSVLTDLGIRAPDVAWASAEFMRRHGFATPYPRAPEICVEVLAPADTEDEIAQRIRAYLTAGAREVWTVAETGAIRYFGAEGERAQSRFGVAPGPPPTIDAA